MLRPVAILPVAGALFLAAFTPAIINTFDTLSAVLWMQTSVEYQASAEQTYHAAEAALARGLADPQWTAALEQTQNYEKLPPAVIFDLDETVLDNSRFQARQTLSGQDFLPAWWNSWTDERAAGLVPGAKEFIDFAKAQQPIVTPLYLTNRTCKATDDDSTVQVLRKLGLPLDNPQQELFCDDGMHGDKTIRRERCAAKFRIVLMFGDQLGDFLTIPTSFADIPGRERLFKAHEKMWGERWFQLPNPAYGSWYDATGATLADKLKNLRM
jgi:5'-nucleotidase (lipoprotein e(P4) family)